MSDEASRAESAMEEFKRVGKVVLDAAYRLDDLLSTGNYKYLSREAADELNKTLLEGAAASEDLARAMVKKAKTIKRMRFRDKALMDKVVIHMAEHGESL